MANERYDLYAITANTTVIGGVGSQSLDTGTEVRSETSSGAYYPLHNFVVSQKPSATFTTTNVAAILALIPVTGLDLSTVTGGLILWAYKHADGGTRAGATSHRKFAMAKGLAVPSRLTVTHRGDATVTINVHPIANGATAPFVYTDSQTVSAAPTTDPRWTLGPLTVGNVLMTGSKGFDIDFGVNALTEGADSSIWDTRSSILTITPRVTIRGVDVAWMASASVPLGGLACTNANTALYLANRADGGTLVANGTASHVKFSMPGLATVGQAMGMTTGSGNETVLNINGKFDGTNAPIVVNTASAIT
jgi:hypothetical protein